MVTAAELAASQDVDLYNMLSSKGMTIHDAIGFLAAALENEELVYPYAKLNARPWFKASGRKIDPVDYTKQFGGKKLAKRQWSHTLSSTFLAWLIPYTERFPESTQARNLLRVMKQKYYWSLQSSKITAPLYNDYSGASFSCLFDSNVLSN